MQFSAIQLFLAVAAAQVVAQIGDGQIQAPTGTNMAVTVKTSTVTSMVPYTVTSQPAPYTTMVPHSVVAQISDGQIQAPPKVTLVPSVVTPAPVIYQNTSTLVSTILSTSTIILPVSSAPAASSSSSKAMTSSAAATTSSVVAPVSSSAAATTSSVVAPVSSAAVSSKSNSTISTATPSKVAPYTANGASLPTAAAGLFFLAGAAALL